MSISMYQASIPPLVHSLTNLNAILEKAIAHAEAKKIDPTVLVNARLYPDMFPLARQIMIATDVAKGAASRLAGAVPPKYEDSETTFSELIARINKTITHLESFTTAQIDGSEDKDISLTMRNTTASFKGQSYLLDFVMPNVYFHVTTVYAILRHNGVEIGKQDFLGHIY